MMDRQSSIAILHYTAPPIIGGVEAVIQAHAKLFTENGYTVTVVAGRGGKSDRYIPEMDSLHPQTQRINAALERGEVPTAFHDMTNRLVEVLHPIVEQHDYVIIHNVLTMHFNLPLTAALCQLLDQRCIKNGIAWCHDFAWENPSFQLVTHHGYPWDLMQTQRSDLTYVVVSREKQQALGATFQCPAEAIHVVYNGVEPRHLLGLQPESEDLIERLALLQSDLVILMPVRITPNKNIEYALGLVAALKALACRTKLVITGPPDPHDIQSMQYFQTLRACRADLSLDDDVHFIFEMGHDPSEPLLISSAVVGDLLRMSDLMFMPSISEGFGIPVLEAGLLGIPAVCSDTIPAAVEIGQDDVILFDASKPPGELGKKILHEINHNALYRFRRRVKQHDTWQSIFSRDMQPLFSA